MPFTIKNMPPIGAQIWCASRLVIPAIFVSYGFWYVADHGGQFATLALSRPLPLLAMIVCTLFIFLLLSRQLVITLSVYNLRLGWTDSIWLTIGNNLLNYLPLRAGLMARGMYLRTYYGLGIPEYIAATTASQLIQVLCAAVVGATVGFVVLSTRSVSGVVGRVSVALILGAVLVVLFWFVPRSLLGMLNKFRLTSVLSRIAYGLAVWSRHPSCVAYLSMLTVTVISFGALRLWLSFYALDSILPFTAALFIQTCSAVSFTFSVIPGNLAVREGLVAALAVALGASLETSIAAALVDRLATAIVVFSLGPLALHQLTSHRGSMR